MKVLKPDRILADDSKDMGAPAVTTPIQLHPRESTKMRRTGIWMSVVGGLLTLLGGLTVLATWDGAENPSGVVTAEQPPTASEDGPTTATTTVNTPAPNRPPGTVATGAVPPGVAALPPGPPPATPQEVADLLAGLPMQLEQAASSTPDGRPRDLTPEEVQKIVDDMLRQLGIKP